MITAVNEKEPFVNLGNVIPNRGDILEKVKRGIIVHGCNCMGAFGSGIAGQIRKKFPEVYDAYRDFQPKKLGKIQAVTIVPNELWIVNAFTQYNFGADGNRYMSYDAIVDCFNAVGHLASGMELIHEKEIWVHYPAIGAGLGGGDWEIIHPIIKYQLSKYHINHSFWQL